MKKNLIRGTVLCAVLAGYSYLYLATSYNKCNDECEKFLGISKTLSSNPFVASSYLCETNRFCVLVKDSISRDWSGLSDSTCTILQERAAPNYVVSIISTFSQDTLRNRQC